jgi:translation initiation factor IF-2
LRNRCNERFPLEGGAPCSLRRNLDLMQVVDLAKDLRVSPETLLALLRAMGIPARDAKDQVPDGAVAKVLARVERERRGGKKSVAEAIEAAMEESQTPTRRRRRRAVEETAAPPKEDAGAESGGAEEVPAAESTEGEGAGVPAEAPSAGDAGEEARPAAKEKGAPAAAAPGDSDRPADAEAAEVGAPGAQAAAEETAAGDEGGEAGAGEPSGKAAAAPAAGTEGAAGEGAEAAAASETAGERAPDGAEEAVVEVAAEAAPGGEEDASEGEEEAARPKRRVKLQSARKDASPEAVRPTPAASAGPGGQVRIQADGYTADGRKKDRKKGKKRGGVDQDAVQDNIQRVMAELKGGGGKKRRKKGGAGPTREEREAKDEVERQRVEEEAKTVRVNEFLTVAELSDLIDIPSSQLVGAAFKNLGLMITINQRLDFDQIELLLDEFNFKAMREEEYAESAEEEEEVEDPESLKPRPPVVTVMGHVDHGKTLLLDSIRKTNVVAGESGGITQHIGAYHVELDDGRAISFLDTPGHAAFTAMRARGADVTDIVVLVVAADDSIMPQTIEAISHAKNAGVPLVVAVNKMDLPAANPTKVKQELLQHEVTVEDFGGEVLLAEISAKSGMGIDDLLEKILLQAEILELRANPDRPAQATVIESKLDVGKGPVCTVLVQKGTLKVGDAFVVGRHEGRVRAMLDERGKAVKAATPGVPVQILGTAGVPQAGDSLTVMDADRASEIAQTRQRLEREKQLRIKDRGMKLGDFAHFLGHGEVGRLPLIVKADVDGSVQAVSDSLEQLSTSEVAVEIIHRGVGAINESDVLLAETAGAVIIGFRVRPDTNARHLAEQVGVDLRLYEVIYEAVDEIRSALEGMLSPEEREKILGTAEVREVFKITRVGTIAGCYVTEGVIERKSRARVIRDGIVVYTGEFASLKRFKDDVREVREGFECGIGITNFNDVKVGDLIECYQVEEFARTLASSGARAGEG